MVSAQIGVIDAGQNAGNASGTPTPRGRSRHDRPRQFCAYKCAPSGDAAGDRLVTSSNDSRKQKRLSDNSTRASAPDGAGSAPEYPSRHRAVVDAASNPVNATPERYFRTLCRNYYLQPLADIRDFLHARCGGIRRSCNVTEPPSACKRVRVSSARAYTAMVSSVPWPMNTGVRAIGRVDLRR